VDTEKGMFRSGKRPLEQSCRTLPSAACPRCGMMGSGRRKKVVMLERKNGLLKSPNVKKM